MVLLHSVGVRCVCIQCILLSLIVVEKKQNKKPNSITAKHMKRWLVSFFVIQINAIECKHRSWKLNPSTFHFSSVEFFFSVRKKVYIFNGIFSIKLFCQCHSLMLRLFILCSIIYLSFSVHCVLVFVCVRVHSFIIISIFGGCCFLCAVLFFVLRFFFSFSHFAVRLNKNKVLTADEENVDRVFMSGLFFSLECSMQRTIHAWTLNREGERAGIPNRKKNRYFCILILHLPQVHLVAHHLFYFSFSCDPKNLVQFNQCLTPSNELSAAKQRRSLNMHNCRPLNVRVTFIPSERHSSAGSLRSIVKS